MIIFLLDQRVAQYSIVTSKIIKLPMSKFNSRDKSPVCINRLILVILVVFNLT
jgi:hypothetical protein